jgi:hypothetical protein
MTGDIVFLAVEEALEDLTSRLNEQFIEAIKKTIKEEVFIRICPSEEDGTLQIEAYLSGDDFDISEDMAVTDFWERMDYLLEYFEEPEELENLMVALNSFLEKVDKKMKKARRQQEIRQEMNRGK